MAQPWIWTGTIRGRSAHHCLILADRWSDKRGHSKEENESWILRVADGRFSILSGHLEWLTCFWGSFPFRDCMEIVSERAAG